MDLFSTGKPPAPIILANCWGSGSRYIAGEWVRGMKVLQLCVAVVCLCCVCVCVVLLLPQLFYGMNRLLALLLSFVFNRFSFVFVLFSSPSSFSLSSFSLVAWLCARFSPFSRFQIVPARGPSMGGSVRCGKGRLVLLGMWCFLAFSAPCVASWLPFAAFSAVRSWRPSTRRWK